MEGKTEEIVETMIDLATDEVRKAKQKGYFGKDLAESVCYVIKMASMTGSGEMGRNYGGEYGEYGEYGNGEYGRTGEFGRHDRDGEYGNGEYGNRRGQRYGRSGQRYG